MLVEDSPLKKLLYVFASLIILLFSCNLGFTSKAYYYIQQSNPNEIEDTKPTEDISLSFPVMFDILEPFGNINQDKLESYLLANKDVISSNPDVQALFFEQLKSIPVVQHEIDTTFALVDFNSFDFKNKIIRSEFSSNNVPKIWYEDPVENTDSWQLSDDSKYLSPLDGDTNSSVFESIGPNTSAGVNPITSVEYFKYEGKNPFFSIDSSYNTNTFINTEFNTSEEGMKRFIFYRFKGKGGGIVNLDNMLVAVDTYTSLIFSFAVPTEFETLLGEDNPLKWEAVEVAATAPDGQSYKFYEYDPAGYVDSEGNFVMSDWYLDNLSVANAANKTKFFPQFTGISPYLINLEIKRPTFEVTSNLSDSEGYYTKIHGFDFVDPPKEVASYDIYRIDDSSTNRILIEEDVLPSSSFNDYNALLLTGSAKYIVEAKDADGKLVGNSSNIIEGARELTNKETLLRIIESIRYALVDEGAYGSSSTVTITSENGGTFEYSKSGFYTVTYTYDIHDFSPYGISLTTASPIRYVSKNIFASIKTSTPFTGTVSFGSNSLIFNNITIANNDTENPDWQSGTLDFNLNGEMVSYSSTDEETIPFAFYMTKDSFVKAILGDSLVYVQK